ncbi:unnamed protein product [Linum tenue]|uniref:Uncharacterized protein n=1 Tax=Linum tenue TaxID=586396 RepID=A0AAV0IVM4_9ROSI|nr:unnamed protein product [Linum tenue]
MCRRVLANQENRHHHQGFQMCQRDTWQYMWESHRGSGL